MDLYRGFPLMFIHIMDLSGLHLTSKIKENSKQCANNLSAINYCKTPDIGKAVTIIIPKLRSQYIPYSLLEQVKLVCLMSFGNPEKNHPHYNLVESFWVSSL